MPGTEKYDLEFQPQEKRRARFLLRFLLGFALIFAVLLGTSIYVLQRDELMDQIIASWLHPTEPETEPDETLWSYSGRAVFMLCETDAYKQSLRFIALLEADAAERRLTIHPLRPNEKMTFEGKETTPERVLREGGLKQLKAAAEALAEVKIDRYISGDDEGFMKAVNAMGAVTVQVEKRIQYASPAFGITLAQGSQRVMGDMLLRYMRYLGTLGKAAPATQAALLQTILETYLTPMGAQAPEALEQRFYTMVDLLETDVSIRDFFAQRELMGALLKGGELEIAVG